MNQYSTSFSALLERLDSLFAYVQDAKSRSVKISFFQRKRHKVECRLFVLSVTDIQRHAAALIGYFEGYEARGAFQADFIVAEDVQDLSVCLGILDEVIQKTRPILNRFATGTCELLPGAPSKPGPQRTLDVAEAHIESVFVQLKQLLGEK